MPHFRSQRRSLALAAGSLLLAAPLSACGFNNATDEIYVASAGVNYREGPLDVLSAVVVSGQEGSGTFIASFSNNSIEEATTVEELSAGAADQTVTVSGFEPVEVPPSGFVNLADNPTIEVKGEFFAGQYVDLNISFDNTDDIEMSVPVVAAENEYEGLDITSTGSPSESPSETPSESHGESEPH
jgi:hypothetical protein